MPASIAAACSRVSGFVRSTPETSPTNTGWIWRIDSMGASKGSLRGFYENASHRPRASARAVERAAPSHAEPHKMPCVEFAHTPEERKTMSFGKGALLWLLGIPLPIILLLA